MNHARSFLEVAELAADVDDLTLEYASVAASIAILAGFITIAAPELKRSLRQAKQLVEFAEVILRRERE